MAGPVNVANDWEPIDDPQSDWEALPDAKPPSAAAGIAREAALGLSSGLGVQEGKTSGEVLKKTGLGLAKMFELGPNELDKTKFDRAMSYIPVVGPIYRAGAGVGEAVNEAGGDIGEGIYRGVKGDKEGWEEAAHGAGVFGGTLLGGELLGGELRERFKGAEPKSSVAPTPSTARVPDEVIPPSSQRVEPSRQIPSRSSPTTIEGEIVHHAPAELPAAPVGPDGVRPPESDAAQPKSDLSEVDRSNLPGKVVMPETLDIDWDSHPFIAKDDVAKASERIQKGEQPTAIVRMKEDGRPEVVDGHGSTMAALQTKTPIKVTVLDNTLGEEGTGARIASHYLAEDKPEITAEVGDDQQKAFIGQDTARLRNLHERLRAAAAASPANTPADPWANLGIDRQAQQQAATELGGTSHPEFLQRAQAIKDELLKNQAAESNKSTEPTPKPNVLVPDEIIPPNRPRPTQPKSTPPTIEGEIVQRPQNQAGMTHWRYDTRTGRETRIDDPNIKPRANEIIVRRDTNGGEEIISKGKAVTNVKLPKKSPQGNVKVEQPQVETPQQKSDSFTKSQSKFSKGQAGFVTPQALLDLRKLPGEFWNKFIVDPALKKSGLGPKYSRVAGASPTLADLLKRRDNIAHAAREQAAQNVKDILGGASHDKERLAALWADADSRANLQKNHPQEYQQAATDPEVQAIYRRYKQFDQELTNERAQLGFKTLPGDYLRRVYDEHLSGGKAGTQPFEKAVSYQDLPNKSRQATAEWHYAEGRHEFGPSYGTKYIAQKMIALDRAIVNQMAREGTVVPRGSSLPKSIQYNGKTYYSPEEAANLKSKDVYGVYDPLKYVKWKIGENVILAPREITDAAAKEGRYQPIDYKPGKIKTAFQKGTIGLGFGIPHAFANIPRRIMNSYALGAANPAGWARSFKVIFSKELRARAESGMKDPVLRELVNRGAARLDSDTDIGSAWKGLSFGHDLIFNPGKAGGLGGVDVRARMDYADRLIKSNPKMSWRDISDKVEGKFGQYTKENWTKTQGSAAHVVAFPGWIYSSIRAGLEHPIRNTAGAAAIIYAANQTLYKMGMNRREDKDDLTRIHVGNYALSPTVFSEPFSKAVAMPLMMAAQPLIRGGSSREAVDTFLENIPKQSGRVLYNLVPYYAAPIELMFNRMYAGSEREIWRQGAFDRKGKTGLSEGTEAILRHVGERVIPQLGRLAPEGESSFDIPSFLGSQVGLPMFRQDAEERLARNLGITNKASRLKGDYMAQQPKKLSELYKSEPALQVDLMFQPVFTQITKGLRQIDSEMKEFPQYAQALQKGRAELLKNADELNDKYYELREKSLHVGKGRAPKARQAGDDSTLPETLESKVK